MTDEIPPERVRTLLATRRVAPSSREWSPRLRALMAAQRRCPSMASRCKAEITAMFEERSAWIEHLRKKAERHVAEDLDASLNCSMRAEIVRGLTRRQCNERRRCFLCGKWPIPQRRQHWCSDACVARWFDNHSWGSARIAALRRDGYKCVRDPTHRASKEVNHIDPRNGRGYHEGCMHHQANLETLCHPCHVAETTRQARERVVQGVVQGVEFVVQGDRHADASPPPD